MLCALECPEDHVLLFRRKMRDLTFVTLAVNPSVFGNRVFVRLREDIVFELSFRWEQSSRSFCTCWYCQSDEEREYDDAHDYFSGVFNVHSRTFSKA